MHRVCNADLAVYTIMSGTNQDQIAIVTRIHCFQEILVELQEVEKKNNEYVIIYVNFEVKFKI